jgi:hypothetical protein
MHCHALPHIPPTTTHPTNCHCYHHCHCHWRSYELILKVGSAISISTIFQLTPEDAKARIMGAKRVLDAWEETYSGKEKTINVYMCSREKKLREKRCKNARKRCKNEVKRCKKR